MMYCLPRLAAVSFKEKVCLSKSVIWRLILSIRLSYAGQQIYILIKPEVIVDHIARANKNTYFQFFLFHSELPLAAENFQILLYTQDNINCNIIIMAG